MHRLVYLAGLWALFAGVDVGGAGGKEGAKKAGDRFLSDVRQLTYEGRRAGEGYFSPDGRHLIFQSEREEGNPFFQIYMLDLQTGDTHRVSTGVGKTTCAFFRPGSDEVLFASTHLDPKAKAKQEEALTKRVHGKEKRYAWDYDESYDIFAAKRDGTGLRRLTTAVGYDAEGAYSPDGKRIVFCSMRDRPNQGAMTDEERKWLSRDPAYFGEVYLMNADGSGQRRLTDWPGYDGGPFFSPDGKRIVWRHFKPGGLLADVYTMKPDGTDRRRLTDFKGMSWAPYFHPSGAYVIFSADKPGKSNFELFLVDGLGEKEPVRVTYTEGFDGLPVFSPHGDRLCWTSTRHKPGGRAGQLFLGTWDHAAALAALRAAPARGTAGRNIVEVAKPPGRKKRAAGLRAVALSPHITKEDLHAHLSFLASDAMEGRMTGSAQAREAAEYIADRFREAGLKPFGDKGTYFQSFLFSAGVRAKPEENELTIEHDGKTEKLELNKDFRPLSLSTDGAFSGELVFAGYGLVGEGYDSYADIDVKDKCVMVLRYFPEDVSMERRSELARYAALRVKAMQARERGAKGILFVTGPRSPEPGELPALSAAGGSSPSGILGGSVSLEVARSLLAGAGAGLQTIQKALDNEDPHARGSRAIPKAKIRLRVRLERIKKRCRNVVGFSPPGDSVGGGEYVVVGAHYDHLGHGEAGGAFGAKKGKKQIYNGADDNASGTAALLELAAALAAERHKKAGRDGVILAAWSGEELGLVGSEHFVDHPPVPLKRIVAYVNFDMVGRMEKNRLMVQGVGSAKGWKKLLERLNVPAGFNLVMHEDPYLPTDSTAFYRAGVPTLALFTGSHEDYHRPSDDVEKIAFRSLERITRFARAIVRELANRPERLAYVKVKRMGSAGRSMRMRSYTGTEPDYAYEQGDGMRLKGVISGGPADKAGIKGGDLIVEIAGMTIKNVYEYSHALEVLKPGEEVPVVVRRGAERITLRLVSEARK